MSAQLRYELETVRAFAGMKADAGPDYVVSRSAEAAIPFGKGVQTGTDPNTQAVVFAGGTFIGISVHTHKEAAGTAQYEINEPAGIMKKGAINVVLESSTGVEAEAAVYVNDTTGNFQNDPTGATLVEGAKFQSGPFPGTGYTEASVVENLAVVFLG